MTKGDNRAEAAAFEARARAVACTCGAGVGAPCRTASGRPRDYHTHRATIAIRTEKAERIRQAVDNRRD